MNLETSVPLAYSLSPGDYGWDAYYPAAKIEEHNVQCQQLIADILGDEICGAD